MLLLLPNTDVFQYQPDVAGVDLWDQHFSILAIPAVPGVYCFYDAATAEPVYIGSSWARGDIASRVGLRSRLQSYRNGKIQSSVIRKVRSERLVRRLLVCCWGVSSASNVLQYEYDAIEKYKPILNIRVAKPIQDRELRNAAAAKRIRSYRLLPSGPLSANAVKRCSCCEKAKALSEFYRNPGHKDLRASRCKSCDKKQTDKKKEQYRHRRLTEGSLVLSHKRCPDCRKTKPAAAFHRNSGRKDGYCTYCKLCANIRNRKQRHKPM